ncbi:hypothetical protein [Bradyrhizobium sp. HKCCYLS20291]|uniref:hypothetical protein n=1 Tax=Bradyrhizobium sp. HKCCYLS20291 TaxID=3420766 RepID=UPI003EB89356
MICLDYRTCGPDGEPSVVHVDQEWRYRITLLADDFETFMKHDKVHKVLGKGDFVLVVSEGRLGDKHTSFYDFSV